MYNPPMNELKTLSCKRSHCPIACALDIFGDKWTLLVIRDIYFGKQTFKALQSSLEKIASNLLAERLKRLEMGGIIVKELYQDRPKRYSYHLTEKGKDLEPVLKSLTNWSKKHIPETH